MGVNIQMTICWFQAVTQITLVGVLAAVVGSPLRNGEGVDLPALEVNARDVRWELQKAKD